MEGNTTLYALPKPEVVLRWREQTTDDFRFCFKFPATISHQAALRHCDDLVTEFLTRMSPLAPRIGQYWLQLPATFGPRELPALWHFLDSLPGEFNYGVYLLFTSGSTGTPKGIVISHRAILDFTDWLTDFCGYTEHEVFGNQSPFYFDTSCKDLYQTLKLGAACVILEKKFFALPLFLLQALDQHGVTAVNWATSAFHLAASSGALEKCVPHALRKIVVGGEALQARYVNMWKRAIPEAELYNMYGPTETTVDCAALHLTRTYRDDEPVPIGKACRNMQLLLLKDDLIEAAPGETGELCVRGSGLAAGYFADAEKTDAAFIQNPLCPDYRDILYRTGDMAVQREDGNFYFLARRDGQIKHMGYRIELGEIETALYSVDGLHDAVCFYDAMRDRIVCVYAGNLDTNTLAKALRTALPKYMLPNVYEKLDALPHNANGKLDRAALKERFLHAQS